MSVGDRILMALSVLMIAFSACAIGYVSLMHWQPLVDTDSEGNRVSFDPSEQTPDEIKQKVVNFLVVGIDYTESDASAGLARGKLTDVIMVVSFDVEAGKVNVLQIPRDTYIGTEYPTGKINAVYNNGSKGGIDNLARVIYDRFRIPLDHYVTITMDGFISSVDAIGGVEIDIKESFTLEGVTFKPGLTTLNGIQAEKFVRERYSRGGDIGRIGAQREFLAAVIKKFKTLSMGELTKLIPTLMKEVTTDLSVGDVLSLAGKALEVDTSDMAFYMVPGESPYVNGYSVWSVHLEPLAEILNEHFRPYSDPVPASELNLIEVQYTGNYYDNNQETVGDLLGGSD